MINLLCIMYDICHLTNDDITVLHLLSSVYIQVVEVAYSLVWIPRVYIFCSPYGGYL